MSTTADGPEGQSSLTDPEIRESLRDLPPSAKLVALVLDGTSPLCQGELAERTLLPDRTVRYAINRLDDAGLLGTRYSFRDARKQVYFLSG